MLCRFLNRNQGVETVCTGMKKPHNPPGIPDDFRGRNRTSNTPDNFKKTPDPKKQ